MRKDKQPLESAEQRAAWAWLYDVPAPHPDGVFHGGSRLQDFCYMVPNGTQLAGTGKRRAIQMSNLKAQGLRPGVSDLVLAYPVHGYHGAYIELKRDRESYGGPAAIKSAIRPEQIEWLTRMRSVGYWVAVAYGAEEFKTYVQMYLDGKPNTEAFWDYL